MSNDKDKPNIGHIEQKLDSAESRKIASAVGGLKEEELSLAWRSQLNAKLSEVSNTRRRKTIRLRLWSYSTGLGLSTVVAVALFIAMIPRQMPTTQPSSADSLEGQMLTAHNSAVRSADIAGEGFSSLDETETISLNEANEWKQEDLEAL